MDKIAQILELAANVTFETFNDKVMVRPFSLVTPELNKDGWYFRINSIYDDLTHEQEELIKSSFPMVVDGVRYQLGGISNREVTDDRIYPASVAFYKE